MANDLVVKLGARLDQFSADMDQAGDIADSAVSKIEKSFSSLNPGINLSSMTALAGGALAGFTALLTALQSINSALAELKANADYAGVSVERFQELRFAATQGGVSSDDATKDLRATAKLLADARDNENSLTRLLDENNIKYKERNGDVISLNKLLTVAGDLLGKFHSMPERVEAAKMLGLSEKWVQALHDGGNAFNAVAASAEAAGAVIDKETIAKAERFDTEWKKSADLLSTQFKAVTADIAVWLGDLIEKAGEFFTELTKAREGGAEAGKQKFSAYSDALAVATKDAMGLTQDVEQLTRVIDRMKATGGDLEIIQGLEGARMKAQALNMELEKANKLANAVPDFPGGVPTPRGRPAAADAPRPDRARMPKRGAGGDENDLFDTQIDLLDKRLATLKADTAATFANGAAQAQLRAEFGLLNAIVKDEGEVTEAQLTRYEELRKSMSATQALQESGIKLTKEHAGEFEKATVAIGNATAENIKAKEALRQLNNASQILGSALSTAFADAIVEGKALNEVFASLIKTLEKAAINALISQIFTAPAGGGTSSFMKFLGFAEGTDNAPGGLAMVGERGPELVNLPKGSQVIPHDITKKLGGDQIIYSPAIDARGASVEAVARLAQILEADRASFAARTIATIQQARRGRIGGL